MTIQNMIKVMTFGTFDIMHPGHLSYFKQARKYGDYLIAVIARDKNVLQIKRRLPSQNEKVRLAEVKKTGVIDKVVLGQMRNKFAIIKKYKPDVVCLGYDQIVDENELKKIFKAKVFRMKPFKAGIYKSSKMKKF
jgi:FAD synthetase